MDALCTAIAAASAAAEAGVAGAADAAKRLEDDRAALARRRESLQAYEQALAGVVAEETARLRALHVSHLVERGDVLLLRSGAVRTQLPAELAELAYETLVPVVGEIDDEGNRSYTLHGVCHDDWPCLDRMPDTLCSLHANCATAETEEEFYAAARRLRKRDHYDGDSEGNPDRNLWLVPATLLTRDAARGRRAVHDRRHMEADQGLDHSGSLTDEKDDDDDESPPPPPAKRARRA